ncbi:MAG TPA: cytochrome C oxidase subunit II [Polyangia bacterium]|jgi:cytochrome c oxidase subunit 2|nr:cytochrome C oxidase subunit II [Polyangia bacterium]
MRPALPHDASVNGHLVDGVLRYVTTATALCLLVMVLVMLVALLFHRQGRNKAAYTHGTRRRDHLLVALVAAAMFFGIDGVLLVEAAADLRNHFWRFPTADENAVRVEVTAQQWAWNFRYAGADGQFNTPDDVVTLNDLRVPIDRPVYLKFHAKDVIHSFYLPNFRTKVDVIPGSETRLWFQAREAGRFEIGCAQHCGVNHYKMRGELRALPADDFDRWLRAAAADSALRYEPGDTAAHDGWDWGS